MHSVAMALCHAAILACLEDNPVEVERLASQVIELSTRQNFAQWLYGGSVYRGWARSASGQTVEGILRIEDAIRDALAAGWTLTLPLTLALKAKALYLANRASEALETIKKAEALVERSGERWWSAELHRLKGVFLAAMGADEREIETSFCEAIRIAREQKSVSLEKRAQATQTEYRRQKAGAPATRGVRLSLWSFLARIPQKNAGGVSSSWAEPAAAKIKNRPNSSRNENPREGTQRSILDRAITERALGMGRPGYRPWRNF